MDKKSGIREFLATSGGWAVLIVAVYAVTLLIMSFLGGALSSAQMNGGLETLWGIFSIAIFVIWIVAGWRTLSMIQPSVFLILPIAGWILYFVIKGFLSLFVGIFVLPYRIAKWIRDRIIGV